MENISSLEITKNNLEKALNSQFGNNVDYTLIDNQDGSFTITFNDTDRLYYISDDGTIINNENTYKISSADELILFGKEVNNGNTFKNIYVYLTNNISLKNETFESIGSEAHPFEGIFNGNYKEIQDININVEDNYQGLFGYNTGEIKNVKVIDSEITGGLYLGGIVGYNNGIIKNCKNASKISTKTTDYNVFIGGICGYNENGTIDGCVNNSEIVVKKFSIGGICGKSFGGVIKNCYNTSNIGVGYGEIGGIVGIMISSGAITNCYNYGTINVSNAGNGGIVGVLNNSRISNCYNLGEIKGSGTWTGGIVGQALNNSIITNLFNIGNLTAESSIGGIVGSMDNSTININYCYNSGDIFSTANINVGAIIGQDFSKLAISNCEWYTSSVLYALGSSKSNNEAIYNENIDMRDVLSVVDADGVFMNDNDRKNNGYPILNWQ